MDPDLDHPDNYHIPNAAERDSQYHGPPHLDYPGPQDNYVDPNAPDSYSTNEHPPYPPPDAYQVQQHQHHHQSYLVPSQYQPADFNELQGSAAPNVYRNGPLQASRMYTTIRLFLSRFHTFFLPLCVSARI